MVTKYDGKCIRPNLTHRYKISPQYLPESGKQIHLLLKIYTSDIENSIYSLLFQR